MTASRHDTPARAGRRRGAHLLLAALLAALPACRAGLPPEPPGADPADANATATPYQVQANPYETSAFTEAQLGGHSGHEHMGHDAQTPGQGNSGHEHMGHSEHMSHGAAADEHAGHGHMGHGGGATKNKSEHAGHENVVNSNSPRGEVAPATEQEGPLR